MWGHGCGQWVCVSLGMDTALQEGWGRGLRVRGWVLGLAAEAEPGEGVEGEEGGGPGARTLGGGWGGAWRHAG